MPIRVFKTTFLFCIDTDGAHDDEGNEIEDCAPTLEEVKEYLDDALLLDVDTDGCGNPVGFQSAEVAIGDLTELSPDEVKKLYGSE